MGSNPYEAPRSDIVGAGEQPEVVLPAEVEGRAMELLGRKRSRSAGASFAVSWAICIAVLIFVTGLVWAFIIGGALAGLISKAYVRGRTPRLVEQVCAELGIPPGAFKPERYLI